MWELAASLRVLAADQRAGVHGPWLAGIRRALRSARLDPVRLLALVPASGHLADFLTPCPTARVDDFGTELARIARTPVPVVRDDLGMLRPTDPGTRALLDAARGDPDGFLRQVVGDLDRYWQVAVAPYWDRLQRLAEADIAWRLERIADGGLGGALATLHPRIRLEHDHLVVPSTCIRDEPAEPDSGIVLVPCGFAWPEILLLDTRGQGATVGYAPRGIATLWQSVAGESNALTALLGRARAQLVQMLDLPATNLHLATNSASPRRPPTPTCTSCSGPVSCRAAAGAARCSTHVLHWESTCWPGSVMVEVPGRTLPLAGGRSGVRGFGNRLIRVPTVSRQALGARWPEMKSRQRATAVGLVSAWVPA